mmetsp:Transcript_29104/g.82124  ORF Transcript_29104/g.82124 Transcript_29104/m.82124 type:complete len:269 (-) Transcript_29104:221-1027(-)
MSSTSSLSLLFLCSGASLVNSACTAAQFATDFSAVSASCPSSTSFSLSPRRCCNSASHLASTARGGYTRECLEPCGTVGTKPFSYRSRTSSFFRSRSPKPSRPLPLHPQEYTSGFSSFFLFFMRRTMEWPGAVATCTNRCFSRLLLRASISGMRISHGASMRGAWASGIPSWPRLFLPHTQSSVDLESFSRLVMTRVCSSHAASASTSRLGSSWNGSNGTSLLWCSLKQMQLSRPHTHSILLSSTTHVWYMAQYTSFAACSKGTKSGL